jgi:hypothetical protein
MNARQRKKALDGRSPWLLAKLYRQKDRRGVYRHRRYTLHGPSPRGPLSTGGMPTTPAALLDALGMRGEWSESSCMGISAWNEATSRYESTTEGKPFFYACDSESHLDVCEPIVDGDRDGAIGRAMERLQDSVQMWRNRRCGP